MDVVLYLERKRYWCEENSQDQKNLGNDRSAAWWDGRAKSFQEILGALRTGIVTPDGIEKLDLSNIN